MSWGKVDDQYPDHPKIVAVGPLGLALHIAAICYCARYLTDGFVPAAMITRLINLDGIQVVSNGVSNTVTHKQLTGELTKAGLFEIAPGGYQVHDYLKYNPAGEEVRKERAENAARQAAWKASRSKKPVSKSVSNPVNNGVPSPSPIPLIEDLPPVGKPAPSPQYVPIDEALDPSAEVFSSYSENIGMLTKIIADKIDGDVRDYSAAWVVAAIEEATRNEKRSLAYVEGILKRWKQEGFRSDTRPKVQVTPAGGARPQTQSTLDKSLAAGRLAMQKALEQESKNGNGS